MSPTLEGGAGSRISHVDAPIDLRSLRLEHVLIAGDMLFTRWSRERRHREQL